MPFYKATLSYKGTRYLGWQIQPEGLTVQGELNRALATISKTNEIHTIGSGRTDAGVHALGQVARLETPLVIEPKSLALALNANLPPDIRVLDCHSSHQDFHPTYGAQSKWYSYFFINSRYPDSILGELVAENGFSCDEGRMQAAAKAFEGTHDFANFYTEGTEVSSTTRTIFECSLHRTESFGAPFHQAGPVWELRFHGEGFLKQMVRLMVGAIWNAGRGKIEVSDISRALQSPQREKLSAVAPAHGLYLMRVVYPSN
jgi:tRNA pseudouridine38-40 synthase